MMEEYVVTVLNIIIKYIRCSRQNPEKMLPLFVMNVDVSYVQFLIINEVSHASL